MVVLMDPGDKWDEFLRNKRVREKRFLFDSALGPSATQVNKKNSCTPKSQFSKKNFWGTVFPPIEAPGFYFFNVPLPPASIRDPASIFSKSCLE